MSKRIFESIWPSFFKNRHELDEPWTNKKETNTFLGTALALHGSVTPLILSRLLCVFFYCVFVVFLVNLFPSLNLPITPFEYSGIVLGLLIVVRVNAGMDRWWEARKIWGGIVNQSRNLAIVTSQYAPRSGITDELINWIAVWPHTMKERLRDERDLKVADQLLGPVEAAQLRLSPHMPMYVGLRIARILHTLRSQGLDSFAFHRAEQERSVLIDNIGKCERIKNTPMPLVLAIKVRRFILLFISLLPFALVGEIGWLTPFIVSLASYPMFSLDEIGLHLQDPFVKSNLSHLPLNDICDNIQKNVLSVKEATGI